MLTIIIHKNYPIYVIKMKIKELDKTKCYTKFLTHNLNDESEVYVKCDSYGNIQYKGNLQKYSLFDINKH